MKKGIVKIILLTLLYVAVSVGLYFLLDAFDLLSVSKIRNLVSKVGVWGYVLFFIFQVLTSTFICVVPFEDEVITTIAIVLFGPIKGFFIASFNMFVTSSLQFLMGRTLGKNIIIKFLGEESLNKYENYLKIRGELMLPVLYCIPLFPHDSLCILAGMAKMKYWYFAIVTLIMRSIEIASLCFLGSGLIDFGALSIFDWIIFINIIVIDIYLILKLQKYIEYKINSRNKEN